ncbi:MAG: methionine ABC transporter ATP-binding protein [Gammaproteobacteria bacterium]
MIILNEITKKYSSAEGEITALQNINLQVKPGEILGIIGKSGAGKSTLIRCVNLLEKPSQGQVIVAGKELTALSSTDLRAARRKIGMIFQHFNLLSSRTVYDNIAFPLELSGCSAAEIAETIIPLLELTGLTDKKNDYPSQLSGGQKQRVAIARALASKPHVLLSDEATSALDPETTNNILELLKSIRDKLNLTILLITHEMSVIKACCDRVGILHQGQLIEENEVGEFFAHPKTAIAKNFITSSLTHSLPRTIATSLSLTEQPDSHQVWRLWFWEKTATQPIISQLINKFKLRINILQANVEYVKYHAMGIMILAVAGENNKLEAAVGYLQNLGVQLEVIGYVPNDIIPFA